MVSRTASFLLLLFVFAALAPAIMANDRTCAYELCDTDVEKSESDSETDFKETKMLVDARFHNGSCDGHPHSYFDEDHALPHHACLEVITPPPEQG